MASMEDHLRSRWFNTKLYPNTVVTDEVTTFVFFNLSGTMVGYQTYRPDQPKQEIGDQLKQRYWSHVTKPFGGLYSHLAVWGLETVRWDDPVLFLTEGVFDACRLHWHGLPAVAMLGNNSTRALSWLAATGKKTVACVQGDHAGLKLAEYGDTALYLPEGHDVGSLSEEQFLSTFGRWL